MHHASSLIIEAATMYANTDIYKIHKKKHKMLCYVYFKFLLSAIKPIQTLTHPIPEEECHKCHQLELKD